VKPTNAAFVMPSSGGFDGSTNACPWYVPLA
jgi:hypothetical protein